MSKCTLEKEPEHPASAHGIYSLSSGHATVLFTMSLGSRKCGDMQLPCSGEALRDAKEGPLATAQVRPHIQASLVPPPTKPQHQGRGGSGMPTKGSPVENPIFLWHLVNSILK